MKSIASSNGFMITARTRIADRIVSVSQPHVRPIKRGKAGAATEFGAKISASLIDGVSFVDRISWDAYNETGDLIGQIKAYRTRFGHYPESVHADKIYRTRDNRKFCKKHGIRLSGPPLGRPPGRCREAKGHGQASPARTNLPGYRSKASSGKASGASAYLGSCASSISPPRRRSWWPLWR